MPGRSSCVSGRHWGCASFPHQFSWGPRFSLAKGPKNSRCFFFFLIFKPSKQFLFININKYSSFIRHVHFPLWPKCGVWGEPLACQVTGSRDHPCIAICIYPGYFCVSKKWYNLHGFTHRGHGSAEWSMSSSVYIPVFQSSLQRNCPFNSKYLFCSYYVLHIQFWVLVICVPAQLLSHVQLFCDPLDYSPPGSSVHGISQARILE